MYRLTIVTDRRLLRTSGHCHHLVLHPRTDLQMFKLSFTIFIVTKNFSHDDMTCIGLNVFVNLQIITHIHLYELNIFVLTKDNFVTCSTI